MKKAVWSEDFSMPEIKKIANTRQATINDVLMAVASGAIRRYMDLHKDKRTRNIRAFILVNMRARSYDDELGNKFGLVFLGLPLDRNQPLERLEAIKSGMDSLKASAEYAATYLILNILGQVPRMAGGSGNQDSGYKRNGSGYQRPWVSQAAIFSRRSHRIHCCLGTPVWSDRCGIKLHQLQQ